MIPHVNIRVELGVIFRFASFPSVAQTMMMTAQMKPAAPCKLNGGQAGA